VAAIQLTFTYKQYTEYTEQNIYRVFQKELYNYLDFKCGSARGGGIGYYSTTCMKSIVYLDMLQEFLIPSLWLRYGPLDLGVGVTVEVP
jgi:hypothetical protein